HSSWRTSEQDISSQSSSHGNDGSQLLHKPVQTANEERLENVRSTPKAGAHSVRLSLPPSGDTHPLPFSIAYSRNILSAFLGCFRNPPRRSTSQTARASPPQFPHVTARVFARLRSFRSFKQSLRFTNMT